MPEQFPHDNQAGLRNPAERGISYRNVTIETSDNIKIRGWFMMTKNHKYSDERQTPTLIFMHENAGNLGHRVPFYKYIIDALNVNILSMAYRGYSYSD